MRTCAQLVSYEVSLALSRARRRDHGPVAQPRRDRRRSRTTRSGSSSRSSSASSSSSSPAIAETNRPPFDLPEADTELVAGYHTEYSGMRWGLFPMAEYINMIMLSALAVTLFFGGWHGPWATARAALVPAQALRLRLRLHLAARDAAAPALRPADALRLEGAAARSRRSTRVVTALLVVVDLMSPQPIDTLKGFARHVPAALQEADHAAVPGVQAAASTRASAAGTGCTGTRTGSRSASAARSARPPARPTASASSPPRTRPTTASPPASATRASTRST